MKCRWYCQRCREEFNEKKLTVRQINALIRKGEYSHNSFSQLEQFNDKNYYEVECSNGHKTNLIIQNEMYEIHFDFGVIFYEKEMYRPAFLEFIAAFECFIQYGNIYMLGDGTYDEYKEMLSSVVKLSERQLGGFLYQYYNNFRKKVTIKSTMITLRNDVIHNGHFPTKDETKKYGEYVLNFIRNSLIDFSTIKSNIVEKFGMTEMLLDKKFGEIMRLQQGKEDIEVSNVTMSVGTILSGCVAGEISTMEECVDKISNSVGAWEL